ncbi:MAG: hypothetical protein UIC64_07250 [Agathobacter sp.]|nr:hypothetical protein [Agathobacter sp.]
MKNKKVAGVLLATSFCAATMTACGVYGAPEPHTEFEELDSSDSKKDDEADDKKDENGDDSLTDQHIIGVYGPQEDYE